MVLYNWETRSALIGQKHISKHIVCCTGKPVEYRSLFYQSNRLHILSINRRKVLGEVCKSLALGCVVYCLIGKLLRSFIILVLLLAINSSSRNVKTNCEINQKKFSFAVWPIQLLFSFKKFLSELLQQFNETSLTMQVTKTAFSFQKTYLKGVYL